jgi:hypothetical protein
MSSAEAMVNETVGPVHTVEQTWYSIRAAAALAVIAVTQLAWVAGVVYGVVRLLM